MTTPSFAMPGTRSAALRLVALGGTLAILLSTVVLGADTAAAASTDLDANTWQSGRLAGNVSARSHPADPIGFVLQEDRVFPQTPTDRYQISRGCYSLTDAAGATLLPQLRLQATDLGTYMFYTADETYVTGDGASAAVGGSEPGAVSEWLVDEVPGGFTVQHPDTDRILTDDLTLVDAGSDISNESTGLGKDAVGPEGASIAGVDGAVLSFSLAEGCAVYPEPEINVSGPQPTGTTSYEEVSGYIDAHVHWMAFEFIGGGIRCGKPWNRYGVTVATLDCPDHEAGGGAGEAFITGGDKAGQHDTTGWPTFVDWPDNASLTHEAMYYAWVERAWRAGLRSMVNLLVDNRVLCEIYPFKRNPCDETNTLRLEVQAIREMERYIDAQYGGPGRGFLSIVSEPFEARAVMNSGRMALILGIETSELFDCRLLAPEVDCTEQHVKDSLDEFTGYGVSQMEILNKYDSAFAGVTGDGGTTGAVVNNGNLQSAGTFWDMKTCPEEFNEHQHDKEQANAGQIDPGFRPVQDAIFGDVGGAFLPAGALPVYGSAPHCNSIGLQPMGEFLVDQLMERGILIDPDHMSTRARQSLLDRVDAAGYNGVISSHSWSDDSVYERVTEMGGMRTPYAGNSSGFVGEWKKQLEWVDPRYVFGFGYGADTNGFGGQGQPRGADAENPVTYPYTGFGGVVIDKQVSGERVYDLNVDGVDHYGLYADWYQDLKLLGGDAILADMARGSEAYLQTWERATGAAVNQCRENTGAPNDPSVLQVGMSSAETIYAYGQPESREGNLHVWCVVLADGSQAKVTGTFDSEGHLIGVDATEALAAPTPVASPSAAPAPTTSASPAPVAGGPGLPATGYNLGAMALLLMGLAAVGSSRMNPRRRD